MHLFENIVACTILPNMGIIFTTIILIVSLIVKQQMIVYLCIGVSYLSSFFLLSVSLLICVVKNKYSKSVFCMDDTCFIVCNKAYPYHCICSCKYYVCKWYAIPIAFIYKQQRAGLIYLKLQDGTRIQFKLLYKDYLICRSKIAHIKEI